MPDQLLSSMLDVAGHQNIRFSVSYDGTDFSGSQRQPNARTVQGELESALSDMTGQAVSVTLAGRTDRGVHAIHQVANAKLNWTRSLEALKTGINALTGSDLTVQHPEEVEHMFHARFSAIWREYRYRYWFGPFVPAIGARYVWFIRRFVDVEQMQGAVRLIEGEHDFASFAGDGFGVPWGDEVTHRKVDSVSVRVINGDLFGADQLMGTLVEFVIRANAFLPHMVRNIAGALAEIGIGRRDELWLAKLLDARDRREADPPAPSNGLVLWDVGYPSYTGAA